MLTAILFKTLERKAMDIVVGEACIYVVGEGKTQGWVLHGNRVIFDRDQALQYAYKVNQLIQGRK